ncbi:hypothetical protein ACLHDG_10640 [Sulfurovum sp. CS9]|uniref:hypothetical protein n=1 Tax=Sulfurovum sp. CS9 TaxID=3391146 RepID=UPI0039EB8651
MGFWDAEGLYPANVDNRTKEQIERSKARYEMWRTYQEMKKADTIGIDKYFHCLANCRATNLGLEGKKVAQGISDFREWYQGYLGDTPEDCASDEAANQQGQKGGNCVKTCEQFKLNWMPEWVEQ